MCCRARIRSRGAGPVVDNLEWADGYDLQFGLYGSDPQTPELERTPKPASIAALSGITKSNALPWWLLEQYLPD